MIQPASAVSVHSVRVSAPHEEGLSSQRAPAPFPSLPLPISHLLTDGIAGVEQKAEAADAAVRSFTLDDSMPVHQVTYALEQARLSLELALQVRSRMLEGYQQLMNMQL